MLVTWTPPPAPPAPAAGYQVQVTVGTTTTTTNVTGTSHTMSVSFGVYSISVISLSQHLPSEPAPVEILVRSKNVLVGSYFRL